MPASNFADARWSKTRMANVVVDPKADSEAFLPDLTNPTRS